MTPTSGRRYYGGGGGATRDRGRREGGYSYGGEGARGYGGGRGYSRRGAGDGRICKTFAMDWYDLESWELEENLYYKLAPNPYGSPMPMKLFVQSEVEQLARELRGNERDWRVPPPFGTPSPSNRARNAHTGPNRNRNVIELEDSDEEDDEEEVDEDQDLTPVISATSARKSYKLTLGELSTLDPIRVEPNPNGPGNMRLYDEEEVQELAYFLHGGKTGHAAYLRELKKTADKAHNTRIKNAIRKDKEERKLDRKRKAVKAARAAKARQARAEEDEEDEEDENSSSEEE